MPKRFFKYTLKSITYLFILLLVYGILMSVATFLPSRFGDYQVNDTRLIDIYVISNGVHTDFVLPTVSSQMNWTSVFDPSHTQNGKADNWVSIGWGDRDFYLNTPTWADLQADTAFNALFGLSTSVLHVSFEPDRTVQTCQKCRKITLTPDQYQAIITHIRATLPAEQPLAIGGVNYWHNDAFYPAVGSYNAFYTCNSWVNHGLQKADVKTALWTVLDTGVIKER